MHLNFKSKTRHIASGVLDSDYRISLCKGRITGDKVFLTTGNTFFYMTNNLDLLKVPW